MHIITHSESPSLQRKLALLAVATALCAAMLVCAVPSADAEGNEISGENLLALDTDGDGVITLTQDYTLTSTLTIPRGTTITLDLDGHTITGAVSSGALVSNSGSLTIEDGAINDTRTTAGEENSYTVNSSGTIAIDNTEISSNARYGVYNSGGDATVTGTSISVVGGGCCFYDSGGTSALSDCTFTQSGQISGWDYGACLVGATSNGEVTLDDCTGTGENIGIFVWSSGGDMVVNGGSYTAATVIRIDLVTTDYPDATSSMTVNGGTFAGNVAKNGDDATLTVYGGTFSVDVGGYCPDGYGAYQDGDTWVAGPEATVTFVDDRNGTTSAVTVISGQALGDSLPADPTAAGYTFAGWADTDGGAFTSATAVSDDMTVTATWTLDAPVVTGVDVDYANERLTVNLSIALESLTFEYAVVPAGTEPEDSDYSAEATFAFAPGSYVVYVCATDGTLTSEAASYGFTVWDIELETGADGSLTAVLTVSDQSGTAEVDSAAIQEALDMLREEASEGSSLTVRVEAAGCVGISMPVDAAASVASAAADLVVAISLGTVTVDDGTLGSMVSDTDASVLAVILMDSTGGPVDERPEGSVMTFDLRVTLDGEDAAFTGSVAVEMAYEPEEGVDATGFDVFVASGDGYTALDAAFSDGAVSFTTGTLGEFYIGTAPPSAEEEGGTNWVLIAAVIVIIIVIIVAVLYWMGSRRP